MSIQTTKDQIAASNAILNWLLEENNNFLILDGPAGVGKTYLINELIPDIVKEYKNLSKVVGLDSFNLDIKFTSTTNKALNVLTDPSACTIFRLLNLRVFEGKLVKVNNSIRRSNLDNTLVIIDESSWVSHDLLNYLIQEMSSTTKVLYVMDKYQCPPIGLSSTPILNIGIGEISINEQVRSDLSDIKDNNLKIRQSIADNKPLKINCGPNIHHLTGVQAEELIYNNKDYVGRELQIATYTNNASLTYDKHIRNIKNLPEEIQEDDTVIFNRFFSAGSNKHVSADTSAVVLSKKPSPTYRGLYYGVFRLINPMTGRLSSVIHSNFFTDKKLEKEFMRNNPNFKLPDIRSGYSLTIHKTQGNTYKNIFIDVGDLNKCKDISLARKLLYVACSRATDNVYLYGNLNSRIGYIYD